MEYRKFGDIYAVRLAPGDEVCSSLLALCKQEKLGAGTVSGIGAAGHTHDWSIDAEIVRSVPCPVVLAGGLDAENVRTAIEAVRPWGVDSFTRTSDRLPDGGSRKNIEKVRAFVQAAHEAFA